MTSNANGILKDAVSKGDVPGVTAAATNAKGTTYEAGFGKRVLGDSADMTPDTVVWIASMTKAMTGAAAMQQVEHGKLGLSVRPLTRDERAQAGVPSGLLVERVSGPAANAGIEPGDVVLSADGKPLDSIEALRNITAKHKDVIALLVQRGDARIFVPVQLG